MSFKLVVIFCVSITVVTMIDSSERQSFCTPCQCFPQYPQRPQMIVCARAYAFPLLDHVTAYTVREIIIRHSTFDCLPDPDIYLNLDVFLEEDNAGINCSCVHRWVKAWPNVQFFTQCKFDQETSSPPPQTPVTSANNQLSTASSARVITSEIAPHETIENTEAPTTSIEDNTNENNSTGGEGRSDQHSHVLVIAGASSAICLLIIIIVVLRVRKRLQSRRSLGRHSLLSYSMRSLVNPIYRDPSAGDTESEC